MEKAVFFSWQSDKEEIRQVIIDALTGACKALSKEGIHYTINESSHDARGAENITLSLLSDIDESTLFIGDLSPVCEYVGKEGTKLVPNSNVMFECGYAIRALGDDNCKQIACIPEGRTITQLPFDICQRNILQFNLNEKDLLQNSFENWFRGKAKTPKRSGIVVFENNSSEIVLKPEFTKIIYIFPKGNTSSFLKKLNTVKGTLDDLYRKSQDVINPVTSVVTTIGLKKLKNWMPLVFKLNNNGKETLDNVEIEVSLNHSDKNVVFMENKNHILNLFPDNKQNFVISKDGHKLTNTINWVNSGTSKSIMECCISLPSQNVDIELEWNIKSRTFSGSGILTIYCKPLFIKKEIEDSAKAGEIEIIEVSE